MQPEKRPSARQWRLIAAHAGIAEATLRRIRRGMPVRAVSVDRVRQAATTLGLEVDIGGRAS